MKENRIETYFYQAECGDAARIRYYGDDGLIHNVLIDSGYERTFNHILKEQIKEINTKKELLDLWVISHIHDDHIGGAIKYIRVIKTGELADTVIEWYYNPPRLSIDDITERQAVISSPMSIGQGDQLFEYLRSKNKLPSTDVVASLQTRNLSGLKITPLSPSVGKLQKLRKKYAPEKNIPLERIEDEEISVTAAAKENDYNIKIEDFDLSKWKEDKSIENGSSITLLTEYDGKKILWLADAHPSDIISSLKSLGYSSSNKIECDWVKVTHHGSRGNNCDDLYNMIHCFKYMFSVNGENRHALPSKEAIARILRNVNRDNEHEYEIHFTYDNALLRSMFSIDGDNAEQKWNFSTHYLKEKYFKV